MPNISIFRFLVVEVTGQAAIIIARFSCGDIYLGKSAIRDPVSVVEWSFVAIECL